jgi:hypothetical protein
VPDSKITDLGALTGVSAALGDLMEIVDVSDTTMAATGTNKKITLQELEEYFEKLAGLPRIRHLNSQHSVSSTTPTKVTDLDLVLAGAGTYTFDYRLIVRAATAGVAPQFNWNFTGTTTKARWWYEYADLSATLLAAIGQAAHDVTSQTLGFGMRQAESNEATTAAGNMGPSGGLQSTATDTLVCITGLLVAAGAGTIELWHGSETATATTVEVGSSLISVQTA